MNRTESETESGGPQTDCDSAGTLGNLKGGCQILFPLTVVISTLQPIDLKDTG